MLTSRARNRVKKATWSISRYQDWTYSRISGTAQSWGCVWMTPTMKMMWHVTVGYSMLEPLPQGKHDRRVSSAESEARQDWPSKPTEDSVATQSPTHAWIRRRGITSHHITSHHITSHHITSHHITSHHITSHYNYITLHYITLHYIKLH